MDKEEELELIFDENWILEAEKEEESYSRFYKYPVTKITCFSLFIDISKNIVKLNRRFVKTNNEGILSQTEIINIIKNDIKDDFKRFRIEHILSFNLDVNQNDIYSFINENDMKNIKNSYLKEVSYTSDIKFNDTIKYLHPINSLFFIYKQKININKQLSNQKQNKSKKLFEFKQALNNKHKTRKRL